VTPAARRAAACRAGSLAAALLAAWPAACAAPDVVAIGGRPDGGLPRYCLGDGPPILVGDGITVGEGNGSRDDVCTGEIAVRTFRHALCTCEDYVTSTPLGTDSFDSRLGPYAPGGRDGAVGVNGGALTSAALTIAGAFTAAGPAGASLGGDLDAAGDLAIGGGLGAGVAVTVGGDAAVAGDVDLAALTVAGTLTVPAERSLAVGTLAAAATERAPVTVAPPCACEPRDLVDIGAFVASHRLDHENAQIGLAPAQLAGYRGDVTLELPCGRYYLTWIEGDGALTLRATGRVALLVDGDLRMTRPLTLELVGADAELDLLIAGVLSSVDTITAGDPTRPRRTRVYVGGGGTIDLAGDSRFAGNLYAPRAAVALSGGATLFGSFFVRRLVQSAPVQIHYDVDILRANAGC
jgi:hypothetical protein